jgi:hypothetical protein
MDWTTPMNIILTGLASLLLGLLTYGVTLLKKYIDAKVTNQLYNNYLDLAIDAIHNAVSKTTETFVKELKVNGTWTNETAKQAYEKAKTIALASLSESAKDILKQGIGDLDSWMEVQIEGYLAETKK